MCNFSMSIMLYWSAMGKKSAVNNLPVTIVFWLISAVLAGEPRKLMKRKLFCHPAYVLEC